MKKSWILLAVGINFLIGCRTHMNASLEKQQLYLRDEYRIPGDDKSGIQKRIFEPTLFWAHYNATERGGLYLLEVGTDGKMNIRIISEPPPDVAINSTISAILDVKVPEAVDVSAKFEAVKSVAELGSRNSANYLIRDFGFNIQSLLNNYGKIDPDVKELYKDALKTAENMSIAASNSKVEESKVEGLAELTKMYALANDTTKKFRPDSATIKKMEILILGK